MGSAPPDELLEGLAVGVGVELVDAFCSAFLLSPNSVSFRDH